MNIISIDLPWKEERKGRRTLAIADLDGNIKTMSASDDHELRALVRKNAREGAIILLDIPIDGCANLKGAHFRPIDKIMASQTLPALPASKSGSRGKSLKELLKKDGQRLSVYEIYPYAIYKVLAYLKDKNLLPHLALGRFDYLIDDGFRQFRPPKYKREKNKGARVRNMAYLYSLLTDPSLGLKFSSPLDYPDTTYTLSRLDRLCDEYDACLGAIIGIYFARSSRHACIAGDSRTGNVLLLADRWLAEHLGIKSRSRDQEKRS